MDQVTQQNEKQWDKLVDNDVVCSQPRMNVTIEKAIRNLNKDNIYGDLRGKNVLCLASGGGQQSIEFAMLGANVTVVDFSAKQLEKDKQVASKFDKDIRIVKSDMRDLSMFADQEFDIVHQPYSINYIQETNQLFNEVARVTKSGGIYHLMFHNPFVHGTWKEGSWQSRWEKDELWHEKGYPLWQPYREGYPIKTEDPHWNITKDDGTSVKIDSPQEFKHTLSTIFNGLISRNFNIIKFKEYTADEFENSEPGTWDHYISVTAPWLFIWSRKS